VITPTVIVAALVAIAVLIFVPHIFRLLVRLATFFIPVAIAVMGIAMIMNDETIFERPGAAQRVVRFVTMNSAAASQSGSGSVICQMGNQPQPGLLPRPRRASASQKKKSSAKLMGAEPRCRSRRRRRSTMSFRN